MSEWEHFWIYGSQNQKLSLMELWVIILFWWKKKTELNISLLDNHYGSPRNKENNITDENKKKMVQ